MKSNVHYSANSDEWATPQVLFDSFNTEFNFTLDAAANKKNAKCARYFTQEDSGLSHPWGGEIVWCNPPYSGLRQWIQKAHLEQRKGVTSVLLIPARTDTAAFHDYIYKKSGVEIRFLRGRIVFAGAKWDAPFPSMLVIFRPL